MTSGGHAVGGMVPRSVQISVALGMVSQGAEKGAKEQARTPVAAPLASSGMHTYGLSWLSSSPLMDSPLHLVSGLGTSYFSSRSFIVNIPCNETYLIPVIQFVFPDPLVTLSSSEDHSSENNRVIYDLWNRTVLTDTPSGLMYPQGLVEEEVEVSSRGVMVGDLIWTWPRIRLFLIVWLGRNSLFTGFLEQLTLSLRFLNESFILQLSGFGEHIQKIVT